MEFLYQPKWRIIDHTSANLDAKQSFAFDDTLCETVGKNSSDTVVRSWVHDKTIVLGMQDTQLPSIEMGVQFLQSTGWNVIVRNSGGLAVVLDRGVLNISLIFKETGLDLHSGYETMVKLVSDMFDIYNKKIEAYEIVGSYCPGKYDLSIDGKKFAGLAQRRIRQGVAVQVYLCVAGSGSERAELIREFYELAIQGEQTKQVYPTIVPETMASLSEILKGEITISSIMFRLFQVLQSSGAELYNSNLSVEEWAVYEKNFFQMVERNERLIRKGGTK